MSRSDIVRPDLQTPVQHGLPLHIAVAGNAGVWRPARQILRHKVIHDMFPKFPPEIHHIMGNVQHFRHPSGILHSTEAAASALLCRRLPRFLLPDLHGDPHHVVTLSFQQKRRHGGIHAPGHTHHYFFRHSALHSNMFPHAVTRICPVTLRRSYYIA